jgi:beta-glucosidase-like glycosyl hydrolase/CubicO group peptidase (beta-lactamase class C family)
VETTLSSLSLREAVGQLVFPWIPGSYASTSSPEFAELTEWVESDGIGGVAISIGLPHSYAAKLNELQTRARVPLLVASDFESGGPGMRLNHSYALPTLLPQGGGTSFPPTMAFGAIGEERYAREYGRITALEARSVGVHLNFAPVLDVNSNPDNPVINTRSFGEDPREVARLGAAYIQGAREGGVLTTAKHFPGHGDTRIDSHLDLPEIGADRARLDSLELVPFRRAVGEGVDAVMTAHVSVPALLGPEGPPATLSPYFLGQVLREEMGFGGLLFTDALRMGAIQGRYGGGEAAVMALQAGADVLLAPADIRESVDAVIAAVQEGRLDEGRIRESVRRILEMKAKAGVHLNRFVDLDSVDEVVGSGPHLAFADSAASRSITLPRDEEGLIPLEDERLGRVLSVTYGDSRDLTAGREFDESLGGWVDELVPVRLNESTPLAVYDSVLSMAGMTDLVLVSAYVPPRSGAGTVAVPEVFAELVRRISGRRPTIVVSFGSPYLLSAFPRVGTYLLAWGSREVSQRAAARALVGASGIGGRLPISLPPFHRVGEGLTRDAVPAPLRAPLEETRDALDRSGILRARARDVAVGSWPGEVAPESVGLDASALELVDSIVREAIADSATPGAALAVGRRGRLVRLRGYGRADWDPTSAPVTPATLYDLASLTKVVGTSTAAALLVDEDILDLEAPIAEILPWWGGDQPGKEEVTIRQLLLHRGGLPPFRRFFLEMEGREAFERAIGELPLEYPAGERTVYSDIGMMSVAFAVEALTGTPLDRFLDQRVWTPLGMTDTAFRPGPELLARIAPTEVDTLYRKVHVHGVVHDENAYAMGGVAGHAGLFSSIRDLAVFAQMMLDGGWAPPCDVADGSGTPCHGLRARSVRILQEETVGRFTRRYDDSSSRALGWDTPSEGSSAGDYLSRTAFGHTGFTGTSIWIDPELELFVVLLTNRVNPTRDNQKHVALRRRIHDVIANATTDVPVGERVP